jgi:hypothetical protein
VRNETAEAASRQQYNAAVLQPSSGALQHIRYQALEGALRLNMAGDVWSLVKMAAVIETYLLGEK